MTFEYRESQGPQHSGRIDLGAGFTGGVMEVTAENKLAVETFMDMFLEMFSHYAKHEQCREIEAHEGPKFDQSEMIRSIREANWEIDDAEKLLDVSLAAEIAAQNARTIAEKVVEFFRNGGLK